MYVSVFDIFKIGIGPSSSHTVGPMKAALQFLQLLQTNHSLTEVHHIQVDLYGSLALTGKGHGTDKAIILGLLGEQSHTVDPDSIPEKLMLIQRTKQLSLLGQHPIVFDIKTHLLWHTNATLSKHTNGLRFTAYTCDNHILADETYYSVGGGFIVTEESFGHVQPDQHPVPYFFSTAEELLHLCRTNNLTISELMLANEKVFQPETEIYKNLLLITDIMQQCIHKGCMTEGILPGGLNVRRRASTLYKKLSVKGTIDHAQFDHMNWINLYAMAVNEENAAGGRVVTAPTNGAAGIIPAVLQYYLVFCDNPTDQGKIDFLLTAAAIAILYKTGASISGAEVGCQGEVGVACSMAAGALTAVLGGDLAQIENAAEIGMEHNLGLPCDPPKGLVQIPCIERNAMGAVKAINAASLALAEDGQHKISLDAVIKTMRQLGHDMQTQYKETSLGGLAVNIIEC